MYPLLLAPCVKDYLWGGTKLKTQYNINTEKEIVAELWMLSCHKDGENVVLNGKYQGESLTQVLQRWGKEALGKNAEKFTDFPLLVKLIDAKENLSVQVHPDDAYAHQNEGENGKTELWYVIDCDQGAQLVYGLKGAISQNELEQRIKDNTLLEVCNTVPVQNGDVFFVTAGTLHAIGGGIRIAEVQQSSNATYRVYDYGRVGVDGKPRELHINKALDVVVRKKPSEPYGNIGEVVKKGQNTQRLLASCELFTTSVVELGNSMEFYSKNSFLSLVVLDGEAHLLWDKNELLIKGGDSVFIPADFKVKIVGKAYILCSKV